MMGRWGTFLINGCIFYEWTVACMIHGLAYMLDEQEHT